MCKVPYHLTLTTNVFCYTILGSPNCPIATQRLFSDYCRPYRRVWDGSTDRADTLCEKNQVRPFLQRVSHALSSTAVR